MTTRRVIVSSTEPRIVIATSGPPGPQGAQGPQGLQGPQGIPGPTSTGVDVNEFLFSRAGVLSPRESKQRLYLEDIYDVLSVRATVGVPPTGGSVVVDVNYDGVSIFDSAQPTVLEDEYTGTVTSFAVTPRLYAGHYVTVDIDEVGATTPGEDLVVTLRLQKVT